MISVATVAAVAAVAAMIAVTPVVPMTVVCGVRRIVPVVAGRGQWVGNLLALRGHRLPVGLVAVLVMMLRRAHRFLSSTKSLIPLQGIPRGVHGSSLLQGETQLLNRPVQVDGLDGQGWSDADGLSWVSLTSTPRARSRWATSRPVPRDGSMSTPAQSPTARTSVRPWPDDGSNSPGQQSIP